MDWLASAVIWLATPLLLAAFWWRSMPAHDAWFSLVLGGALFARLYATLSGWVGAEERLGKTGLQEPDERKFDRPLLLPRKWEGRVAIFALILVLVSLVRTQLEAQVTIGAWRWSSLAPIELMNTEIVQPPAEWVRRDIAQRRFKVAWCHDRGLPPDACEASPKPYQQAARAAWCAARPKIDDCATEFRDIDSAFDDEWREQRHQYLAELTRPNLRGRDLRGAVASGASLAGIDLSQAGLERANLDEAWLEQAYLWEARLDAANLSGSMLNETNLVGARLDRVDLTSARLDGALLWNARLDGADLWNAHLDGASLHYAKLESVNRTSARFGASRANSADFTGGQKLTQSQLAHVIGNGDTILPLDAETGEQLYVWTRWAEPPPTLDALLRHWPESRHDWLRTQWLCPPGVAPERTGRPADPEPAAASAD